jgi:radical SAM protein with 4Fe4S-binding SPASM domain
LKHSLDNFCILPWIHVNLNPNGDIAPCCITEGNDTMGNINDTPIEEIWNSRKYMELRKEFLDGKQPRMCKRCFDKEKTGSRSNRQSTFEKFPNEISKERTTKAELKLKHWDFRFNNLCNLKCRTCGPYCSSSWIPDAKKLNYKNDFPKIIKNKNTYDLIDKNIDNVERIYFAGGEPLLMDEHWYIIKKLDELGRYDVRLEYNTNLTTLKYKNENIIDYWKKWIGNHQSPASIVNLWPSIDEIGERAEIIRSGTVWKKIEDNLKKVIDAGIDPQPSITVSVLNVHRIPTIVNHLIGLGIRAKRISYNLVITPEYYNVSVLNEKAKQKIRIDLLKFILDTKIKYGWDYSQGLAQIMNELRKPQRKELVHAFWVYSWSLDKVRSENIFNIIPELKDNVQLDEDVV